MIRFAPFAAVLLLSACVMPTGPSLPPEKQDGLSVQTAVVVQSIKAEYDWLAANRPGWKQVAQTQYVDQAAGRSYDLIRIEKDGVAETLHFEITSFFGTGIEIAG